MKRKKTSNVGTKSQTGKQRQSSPAKRLKELQNDLARLERSKGSRLVKLKEFEKLCLKARELCDDETLRGIEAINQMSIQVGPALSHDKELWMMYEATVTAFYMTCNPISVKAIEALAIAQVAIFGDDDAETFLTMVKALHYSRTVPPLGAARNGAFH